MNKISKILSVVLAAAVALSVTVVMLVSASAAEAPTFSLNVVSEEGKDVVVSVKLESGSISNFDLILNTSDKIKSCTSGVTSDELIAFSTETALAGGLVTPMFNAGTKQGTFATTADLGKPTELFLITLVKASDAKVTKDDIKLEFTSCANSADGEVSATVVSNLPAAVVTTDPSVTDPSVTDPSVTDPSVTDPSVTDPSVTQPTVAPTDPTKAPTTVAPATTTTTVAIPTTVPAGSAATGTVTNPNTGDNITVSAAILSLLAISGAAVVALRKKED